MRFDTRNKKPHVWSIAVLVVIAAVLIAVLTITGADEHAIAISVVLDLFFLTAIMILVRAFSGQIQYNPYSYNTIYYAGFSLFLLSVLITHMILTVQMAQDPGWHTGQRLSQISTLLTTSAKTYMLLSFPFIAVVSAALCVSNLALIRHEGKRFVNLLGIILSFLLVGGELVLLLFDRSASGSEQSVKIHEIFVNVFAAGYLYFECMLIGIMIAHAITSRHEPEPDKDFLIILGCAIRRDGTPSPLLKDRLDRAIAFRNKQLADTGKELVFVTSGGRGPDEVISESAAMKRYLLENGIPERSILEEDRSTNTFENMKFSREKIEEQTAAAKIAFSTTNYHVFRSGLFARRVKMRAVGMGAKAKWYFWPNALVREFVGLLTEHRGKQAAVITGLIAAYVLLTLCLEFAR